MKTTGLLNILSLPLSLNAAGQSPIVLTRTYAGIVRVLRYSFGIG
jgi:hypothetical protein